MEVVGSALDVIKLKQMVLKDIGDNLFRLNYEKEVVSKDLVEDVKQLDCSSYNIFYGLDIDIFNLEIYFNVGNELDKEKVENYKNNYDLFIDVIKNKILNGENLSVEDITYYNYLGKLSVRFKVNSKQYLVEIPIFKYAEKDNYESILRGYTLYTMENCDYEKQIEDMKYNVINDYFKKGV